MGFVMSATCVFGGVISTFTVSAAKSQIYGDLTYMNYGGWIEITDCSTTVETVEIPEKSIIQLYGILVTMHSPVVLL